MSRHAVIVAGGIGSRLWPISRQATPKQFQKLVGQKTLFQQTYARLLKVLPAGRIWVITGERYAKLVKEQLPNFSSDRLISEPSARNTAPASGLAILRVLETDPDAVIALIAADHYIGKESVFTSVLKTALAFVEKQPAYVATIGIHPTSPHTGYGYIKMKKPLLRMSGRTVYEVAAFHEKPDRATARRYLKTGRYLWNGSYFIFKGETMLNNYRRYAPELLQSLRDYLKKPTAAAYEKVPAAQLDKEIIEKLPKLAVIPAAMAWSDVGDWAALHEILLAEGTEPVGERHIGEGSKNLLVVGERRLIATVGIEDLVVIDTEDILLICHKASVQDVKKIVEKLQAGDRAEYL